jgi:ABC-type lipoprotein release transport system permease subunit
MSSFIPYIHWFRSGFLFLIRSGRSAFALSLMVVAAVSSLIFLSSFAVGVNDAMVRNSVGLFSGHISVAGLPPGIKPEDLKINGVTHVLKRIHAAGVISFGNRIEAINMIGVDPVSERAATAIAKKIIHGRDIRDGAPEILVSSATAERLGVSAGDMLGFSSDLLEKSVNLKVSGIYKTGIASLDAGVAFCPFSALPAIDSSWNAAVFLQDNIEPETIVSRYRERLGKCRVTSWKESMPDLVQLIDLNYVSMSIVIILVFGVVSLGISCAFVVFIFKSLREYGILKAMGVNSTEVSFLIITEIILINMAACLGGVILGVAAVCFFSGRGIDLSVWTSHNQYFAVSGEIFPRLTAYSLIGPPAASMLFGLIAAIWPAALVARKKAVDILRMP